jgi:hypothetical protein
MSIRNRWIAFVNSMADKIEHSDPQSAQLFRKINESNIPPDEKTLEWSMAYVKAQQSMMELLDVYVKQERTEEVMILSSTMLELNKTLLARQSVVHMPREFVKEVKF